MPTELQFALCLTSGQGLLLAKSVPASLMKGVYQCVIRMNSDAATRQGFGDIRLLN